MTNALKPLQVWGKHEDKVLGQIRRCMTPEAVRGALMADAHYGYSQPIGGVVAYKDTVSPSGVGYDISCGIKSVRTNLKCDDVIDSIDGIMDEIFSRIEFGMGKTTEQDMDDQDLFDDPAWVDQPELMKLKRLASNQLGTVGSGNHYVDILVEDLTEDIWVATHFGSRGLGHKIASGFLNLAVGRPFDERAPGENMDNPPTLISTESGMGQDYIQAMELAGRYAYAGRDYVIQEVLDILGAESTFTVHNHHNFAWKETHFGEDVWVVRKGATPLAPGQLGFIGGSMCDVAVIAEGLDNTDNRFALQSGPHGAGRIMSRRHAMGKVKWKTGEVVRPGEVSLEMLEGAVRDWGLTLRGAGLDESPFVYRKLDDVLKEHTDTLKVHHVLRPIGVAMAGREVKDEYKD